MNIDSLMVFFTGKKTRLITGIVVGFLGVFSSILAINDYYSHRDLNSTLEEISNLMKENLYDDALDKTEKLLVRFEKDKNVIAKKGRILYFKEEYRECMSFLISKINHLNSEGNFFLALLYNNDKENYQNNLFKLGTALDKINPRELEVPLRQHYYALQANRLAQLPDKDHLKTFIYESITDLSNDLKNLGPDSENRQKNLTSLTSSKQEHYGDIVGYQHIASSIFILCKTACINNLANPIDLIKTSKFDFGFGVSISGKYVTTPNDVKNFVDCIIGRFNESKGSTKETNNNDVNTINLWLKSVQASLEDKRKIGILEISSATGANDELKQYIKKLIHKTNM